MTYRDQIRSGRLRREDESFINEADRSVMGQTALGQHVNSEASTQFAYKSVFPLSTQRDEVTETNGGTVTKVNGAEYRVRASATAGSVAQQRTRQVGDYIPEHIFLPSIGLRLPDQPTGNAKIQSGYLSHDGTQVTNGTFLEYNSSGFYHKVVSGSTEKYSKQLSIDPSVGYVYRLPFLFYGYGFAGLDVIENSFIDRKSTYYPSGELLFENSNLPLVCRVEGDGTQLDAFVAGRQMSVVGKNERVFRAVNQVRRQQAIANSTDYVPMVSVQIKSNYKEIFAQLREIAVIADADMEVAIFQNGTLTGASFDTPTDYNANEVATQWDNSATAISGGDKIYGAIIDGANKSTLTQSGLPEMPIVEGDTISFCLRLISGTNGTATLTAETKENF